MRTRSTSQFAELVDKFPTVAGLARHLRAGARLLVVAVTAVVAGVVLHPSQGSAQGAPAACAAGTYNFTGTVLQCIVPAGVTQIDVQAAGGQGGSTNDGVAGGLGGVAQGTITVTPGEVLSIYVGGDGGGHGGFGGMNGGDHGVAPFFSSFDGAGGGGSSEVRNAAGVRLVVAGGGGGAGGGANVPASGGVGGQGGIGGLYSGPDGTTFAAPGANASGYQNNGGAGGCGGCTTGAAGAGGSSTRGDGGGGGGGGGGGYLSGLGGGGGGFAGGGGGGGGGLSFVDPNATNVSFGTAGNPGDGWVNFAFPSGATLVRKGPLASAVATGAAVVFDQPGPSTWVVPDDVTAVSVTAIGGSGGGESDARRAPGDQVRAIVKVTPGSTLEIDVGGAGGGDGGVGYGTGGGSGTTCGPCRGDDGFGGGGASAVSVGGTPLVVAGGGGGSGGDADGGSDGATGGAGGLSPQPGFYSFDPNQNAVYGEGGGGGSQSSVNGGKGQDCDDFFNGAGGGGGGGFELPNMGGGGSGGESGDCEALKRKARNWVRFRPPGDGSGGGGAGGGGGRSYVEPGARDVSLGGPNHTGNGSVTLTPVAGGTLTVDAGANQSAYPFQLFPNYLNVLVTDLFGDPIPNVPVTYTVPPGHASLLYPSSTTLTVPSDQFGNAQAFLQADGPPWQPGPFTIAVTAPGFSPTAVTGLSGVLFPTQVTVTSSSPTSQSGQGQPVLFTATVSNPGYPYDPTGSVNFTIDGNLVPGGPFSLDAKGMASTPAISNLSIGQHTIGASYGGDAAHQLFEPSSGNMVQTVKATGTTLLLASSANPADPTAAVFFTATVVPSGKVSVQPTGTVQFMIDGVNFGGPVALATVPPLTAQSMTIQLPSSLLAAGPHVIQGFYSGDNNSASSTGQMSQFVKFSEGVTLQSCFIPSDAQPDCGVAVHGMSLGAFVGAVEGQPAPTGTVQFFVNGEAFGAPAPVVPSDWFNFTYQAWSNALEEPIGPTTFEARYSGDAVYGPATVTLNAPVYTERSVVTVISTVHVILPISPPTTFYVVVQNASRNAHTGGTVQLYNSNVNRAIGGPLPLVNQVATLADQGSCQIGTGQIIVTAQYSGDPDYKLSPGSGSITQYVLSICP